MSIVLRTGSTNSRFSEGPSPSHTTSMSHFLDGRVKYIWFKYEIFTLACQAIKVQPLN